MAQHSSAESGVAKVAKPFRMTIMTLGALRTLPCSMIAMDSPTHSSV